MAPLSLFGRRRRSGARRAPARDARTRCHGAPPAGRPRALRTRADPVRYACPGLRSQLGRASLLVARPSSSRRVQRHGAGRVVRSDRAVHGGRPRAGAYPDLEALVPASYRARRPRPRSGRNCTATNLGALARTGIREVRFAGGTWTFGAERAAVARGLPATGLTADALADFYAESAQAAPRTPGHRRAGADDRGPSRAPASTQDRRAAADRRRLAGRAEPMPSTWSSPTTCPTPGSRTRSPRSGTLMLRFVVRARAHPGRRRPGRPGPHAVDVRCWPTGRGRSRRRPGPARGAAAVADAGRARDSSAAGRLARTQAGRGRSGRPRRATGPPTRTAEVAA